MHGANAIDKYLKKNTDLINVATGAKPDETTTRNILSAIEAGSRRAKAFIDERIVNRTKPLDATLQNKTCLLLIT